MPTPPPGFGPPIPTPPGLEPWAPTSPKPPGFVYAPKTPPGLAPPIGGFPCTPPTGLGFIPPGCLTGDPPTFGGEGLRALPGDALLPPGPAVPPFYGPFAGPGPPGFAPPTLVKPPTPTPGLAPPNPGAPGLAPPRPGALGLAPPTPRAPGLGPTPIPTPPGLPGNPP